MNLEIKADQWYRTRSDDIAYVAATLPFEHAYPILGVMRNYSRSWFTDGRYYTGQDHEFDLVEHLPYCDSFDWVNPKKFKLEINQPKINLEYDKKYVLVNGEVVGPLACMPSLYRWRWHCEISGRWWDDYGTRYIECARATENIVGEFIESKPMYVAFKNADEFMPYEDKWIKRINNVGFWRVTAFNDTGVWAGGDSELTYEQLLAYQFRDGTHCGKKVS